MVVRSKDEKLAAVGVALLKAEEGKPRRFRMVAYTGVQFSRGWGQMMIDLAGIDIEKFGKLPMLLDHAACPTAVADEAYVEKGEGLVLEGYFLDTEHAKHVQKLADQGFPWTASVGIKCLHETEVKEGAELEVNGTTVKGPAFVWSKSKLYETSFITAGPADDATQVEVMKMAKEAEAAMAANLAPVHDREAIRVEVLKEHEAKKTAYVQSLTAAGAKKGRARSWFDDGLTIEQAFVKHSEVMAAERDEAIEKVKHLEKHGKIDERDAGRVKAGLTKGFDPDKAKRVAAKRAEAADLPEKAKNRLPARLRRALEEKAEAYAEWAQKNDEGLLLRSIFPRHQGGHELLHAVNLAEDNSALKMRASEKGLPLAPPYWVRPGFTEALAEHLIAGTEHLSGKGFVEQLAGTWGRNAHAYSLMTVKGYLAALFKPLEDDVGKGWAQRVGITIPSNQEIETYRFLGNPPQIRKWVGNRQTKFFPPFELKVANDTFEGTVDFPVNDFRFDKSGHIMIRMGELGIRARQHWDILGTQVLLNNPTAYDNLSLFNGNHTQGGGFTMKNTVTAADIPALSVSVPSAPTQQEMVAAIMGVVQYFYTFQDQTGSPINGDARRFVVIVPPNLWGPALTAVRAARLNFGQDNPIMEQDYSVEVIPNGWLVTGLVGASTNTNVFYVARVDSQFRPIVFQDVTGWEAQMLGPGSDTTVMKDRIIYGLRAVRGSGPGEWAHIIKATLS